MSNYNVQQQAVILKGIAQQILSMNVPTFKELTKITMEFGLDLIPTELLNDHSYTDKEVNTMLLAVLVYSGANNYQGCDSIKGSNYGEKIQHIINVVKKHVNALDDINITQSCLKELRDPNKDVVKRWNRTQLYTTAERFLENYHGVVTTSDIQILSKFIKEL